MAVAIRILAVFVAAALIDVFYALWFRFSNNGWEHKAAAMSVMCGAAGLFGGWMIISSEGSIWYSVPDLSGLYAGTIIGLRFSKWVAKRWEKEPGEEEAELKELRTDLTKLQQEVHQLKVHQKPSAR